MLHVCTTARTAIIILCQFQHSQVASLRDILWYTASLRQMLISFVIRANLLEDSLLSGRSLNDLLGNLIQIVNERFAVRFTHLTDVLDVGTCREVESFTRFEVRSTSTGHSDIEQVTSRMNPRVKSPLRLIKMALDRAALLEGCDAFCWLKVADVLNDVVLDKQIRYDELKIVISVLNEAFVVGLPTTLRVEDRPIQYHTEEGPFTLERTLRSLEDILDC